MSHPDFVTVHTSPSFHGALLLAGFLKSEGIEARVPGSELSDEFGTSQKLGCADVVVPGADVEKAKDMVAAWTERADASQNGPDGGPSEES